MKINVSKKSIIVIILSVIMFCMIPAEFCRHSDLIEIMSMKAGGVPDSAGVFCVIFLVALAINAVVSLFDNENLPKLTSCVSLVFCIMTIVSSCKFRLEYIKSGYIYLLLTAAIVAVQFIMDKSKK